MRKLYSLLFLIGVLIMPNKAWTEPLKGGATFTVDGISYYVSGTNPRVVTVRGTSNQPAINPSTTGKLIVPTTVTAQEDGLDYTVKYIGTYAFNGCSGLTSVELPNTTDYIQNSAFRGCTGLTSISIPSSVSRIEYWAFADCSNLSTFTIPDAVTYVYCNSFEGTAWYNNQPDGLLYKDNVLLGEKGTKPSGDIAVKPGTRVIAGGVLSGSYGISSISLPNTVMHIGSYALSALKINSIKLPNSLLSIEQLALSYNQNLKSIVIPSSVRKISVSVLSGCENLETIKVEDGNQCFDSRDNCNAIIQTAFYSADTDEYYSYGDSQRLIVGCKNTVIPKSIRIIGQSAFNNCSGLTSIEIPHEIEELHSAAFRGCKNLTTVKIGKGVKRFNGGVFENCTALTEVYSYISEPFAIDDSNFSSNNSFTSATLYVPKGTKEKYATNGWKNFQTIVEREDLVGPLSLNDIITTDDGVTYMVTNTNTLEVQIGLGESEKPSIASSTSGVFEIPASVKGADGLSYSVTSIADYAFTRCGNLTSVIIPDGVVSIGEYNQEIKGETNVEIIPVSA